MKKAIVAVVALLIAVISASAVSAQEGSPDSDPADNLCYEGGAWDDGRCNIPGHEGASELAWMCGWYMARYYRGELIADDVIDSCQHLIIRSGAGEICKTFTEEDETEIICLRADQTGDVRYSECSMPCIVFRFIDINPMDESDCPIVDGYIPFSPVYTYDDFEGFFSDDELASLGLKPYGCIYFHDF